MTSRLDQLISFLDRGGVLVTATRRLRRFVLERYADAKQRGDLAVWPTPAVLFWDDWLSQCWRELEADGAGGMDLPVLLDEGQELWLWEGIIREHQERRPELGLLQVEATAKSIRNAWHLLRGWNLNLNDLNHGLNQDARAFRDYAREFLQRTDAHGWLSRSELGERIGRAMSATAGRYGAGITWLGFDQLTPSQLALRDRFMASGIDVSVISAADPAANARFLGCRDPSHEIESAARWARALLERGEPGPVGVVFLDLAPLCDEVRHVFDNILHPLQGVGGDPAQQRLFHLSLGQPLALTPIVAHGLLVLSCLAEARPYEDLSDVILSPFIGGGTGEYAVRGRLDRRLRKSGLQRIGLEGLHRLLRARPGECPLLCASLDRVTAAGVDRSALRPPAVWADLFARCLHMMGWPGERALNSAEYQAVEAWRESLVRFAGLGLVTAKLSMHEALRVFKRMLRARVFQPQTSPAPVQIMGVMEAGGMEFAHLWLAGMSNDQWPPVVRPNPFLPYALQRRCAMPGASAERTLAHAAAITDRLLGSAPQVVVSCPQRRGEQPCELSPLFAQVPEAVPGAIRVSDYSGYVRQINQARPVLERLHDGHGPPLSPAQKLTGGVGAIRDQAACPFRGFARHRLGAESIPEIEFGLSAAERGSIVHQCLARVWRRIAGQTALVRASSTDLSALISDEVQRVLSPMVAADDPRFRREFIALERQRLQALIAEWLELERTRDPFAVVAGEQQTSFTAAGVEFSLRADRVDRCEDGAIIVFDYKTGLNAGVSQWFGDRPGDPQLPVYLLSMREPVSALAFAQVRRGECTIKGLGSVAMAPGIQSFADSKFSGGRDWTAQQRQWRTVIERLAAAIRDGEAQVDPKSPTECQHCDVRPVCRVFERDGADYEEDGND